MSAHNYDMASTWDDRYVPPQLEQEYPLDPALYGGLTGDTNASHLGRRQAAPQPQNASFQAFDPTYQPQMAFNFNAPQQQPQSIGTHQGSGSSFLAPPLNTGQGAIPHFSPSPSPIYSHPPSPQHNQLASGYAGYQHQVGGMQPGPSAAGPSQHVFDNQEGGDVYASPLSFSTSYSSDQMQMPGQGIHQTSYFGSNVGQTQFNGPSFKRPREDPVAFDDPDQDAEEAGGARGEAAKVAKPCVLCCRLTC